MTSLLMLLTLPSEVQKQYHTRLRKAFPDLPMHLVDHHTKVGPYIHDANILMTYGPMMTDQVVRDAPNLKWIQALGTGVDNIIDLPSLRSDVLITNIHGIHGAPVSEAAIMAMLALSRQLPRVLKNQENQAWERWPARLLNEKTLGILGVGAIAEALASRCKALGMKVIGISSTKRDLPGFDRVFAREELIEAVSELDYFVALTPYSPATHHLVGETVFSAMKPESYFINVARGGVVDEAALMRALDRGQIAGAALDVFSEEPLPKSNPLWRTKNILITPHAAGLHDGYAGHALPVIEENIRKFLNGDFANMINVVRR